MASASATSTAVAGMGVQIGRLGRAQRQGAGLVEDHRIHFGRAFQRGALLDQALAEQLARCRRHHGGHGKAKGAGAGDDQHGGRDVDRMAQVAPVFHIQNPKALKTEGAPAANTSQRRVRPGWCSGVFAASATATRSAIRCRLESLPAAVTRRVSGPVRLTSPAETTVPTPAKTGRLSPVKAAVQFRRALDHHAVHRHPPARSDQHDVFRQDPGDRFHHFGPGFQNGRPRHSRAASSSAAERAMARVRQLRSARSRAKHSITAASNRA